MSITDVHKRIWDIRELVTQNESRLKSRNRWQESNESTKRRPTERKRDSEEGKKKRKRRWRKRKRKDYRRKKKSRSIVQPEPYLLHRSTSGQTTSRGPVYPPLFGPCEEACGHVSSRVPGRPDKKGMAEGEQEV